MDPASLQNLHDIVLPSPVPWWPPAPVWHVLGAAFVSLTAYVAWHTYRRWKRNAYRGAALSELAGLRAGAADVSRRPSVLRTLPVLIKRVALAAFPREGVAELSGDAWLRFLDESAGTRAFSAGPARVLARLAYDPKAAQDVPPEDVDYLFRVTESWIREHRTDTTQKRQSRNEK